MSTDRPQYGEYATPEQQRAAAGLPPLIPDAPTPANRNAGHPIADAYGRGTAAGQYAAVPGAAEPASAAARAPRSVTPAGRIITFALLGFGLFNVLTSFSGFLDLSTTLTETLRLMGVDAEVTNFAAVRTGGMIAAMLMLVGYVLTAFLSIRRLKRDRVAWWIPLVGFVVTMGLVSICLSVVIMSDAGLMQAMITTPAR